MIVDLQCIILWLLYINGCLSSKPKFTLDEFFNYTDILSLTLSPNDGESILIQTKQRIWDRNINENHLHLQTLRGENRKLITTQLSDFKPQWKDEWIALVLTTNSSDQSEHIHLYSILTDQMHPLVIGKEEIHAFTWSTTSDSLYVATRSPWSEEIEMEYENEWKDVIQYREQYRGDTIYRVDIDKNMTISNIEVLSNTSLRIAELICSPDGRQLVFSTEPPSLNREQISDYELYSVDLTKPSSSTPFRLTNNSGIEEHLQWSIDKLLFFTVTGKGSMEGDYEDSQGRLYSLNMSTNRMERWAKEFRGEITDYALLQHGREGIVILGQLSTEIQVYTQLSVNADLIRQVGWIGSYQNLVTASRDNSSVIAFIHSSYETPQEVYFADSIDQLNRAEVVTNVNQLFTERSLPKGKSYRWLNEDDRTEIEGILLYPPDQFEEKNLPLLVLIHGGPYYADLNIFRADWYYCAPMMATEGWLVLQPNYRGSTGYGDEFLRGVRYQLVSRPGKDILYGVDALVRDGIVDPKRLTIGGYSYGGYITNWLITQTTRFNAALSGGAAPEHVADWGLTDIPLGSVYSFGGFPWQVPNLYQQEAALFQVDKVRTPTHIVVGADDIRVPPTENFIFERALTVVGVPTKLIVFPGESHDIEHNPWHEKIKIREELKWLHKYGNSSLLALNETSSSAICRQQMHAYLFILAMLSLLFYLDK